jgi:hypothetical protein
VRRRLGVLCRGRTNRGLVPPLPPHCATRAGAADSLTVPRVLLFDSAIRCEWGRRSLSQPTTCESWLDWTNGAHHQPLVHERRLASVCALFVLWKALAIRRLAQSDACWYDGSAWTKRGRETRAGRGLRRCGSVERLPNCGWTWSETGGCEHGSNYSYSGSCLRLA